MSHRTGYYRYGKHRRRRRQQLFALVALVAVMCFWGMNRPHPPAYTWNPVTPEAVNFFSLGNLAESPDPVALQSLPEQVEDSALKEAVGRYLAQTPAHFKPHVYYLNLKTGAYMSWRGDEPVAAASVIKIPILLDYFRAVGEGKFKPEDPLIYELIHQTGGSGELQYKVPGFDIPSLEVARTMIQISDNSSTNMFIDYLGGTDELNERFRRMGLRDTYLKNWLPDLTGTNKISTRDMATALYNIAYTPYLCGSCQEQALDILKGTRNKRLIPAGLPPGTTVAHKTGDIGESLGDSALVLLPGNDAYLLSIQIERPFNDYGAKTMIIDISKMVYEHHQRNSILVQAQSSQQG